MLTLDHNKLDSLYMYSHVQHAIFMSLYLSLQRQVQAKTDMTKISSIKAVLETAQDCHPKNQPGADDLPNISNIINDWLYNSFASVP